MSRDPAGGLTVLMLADPGLPTRRAHAVKEELRSLLDDAFTPPVSLHVRTKTLRLRPDHTLDLGSVTAPAEEPDVDGRPDVTLMLTEIPRHTEGKPLIAELFSEEQIAVISCPTLGAFASRRRILHALMSCALRIAPTDEQRDPTGYEPRWARWRELGGDPGHLTLHAHTLTAGLRTVVGMVAGNDPWKTVPKLSSALAAAAATGAFGIFYSSIWAMSTYLSTSRLLGVGLLAMTAMVTWLIFSNRLWDSPKRENLARIVLLYNLSTVLTLALCVLTLYLALVTLILIGSLVVIAPAYMAEIIGEDPTLTNYLDIAWLSAAMGVVAGALGSSFDTTTDLRQVTHGQRERQRRYTEESAGQSE